MKTPLVPLLFVTLLASSVVAAVTASMVAPAPARANGPAASEPSELLELARAIERIERRQEQVSGRIDELGRMASPGSGRTPLGELDAAVARYFAERGEALPEQAGEVEALAMAAADDAARARRVEGAFQELLAGGLSQEQELELWAKIADEGLTDELVAAFEARAEREPNDPDVRVELGEAYLQKVFEAGSGPMAGVWAMKADGAFDAALTLDENHWDARFNKAISLSFWPPALGMQGKAIDQFETLLAKQSGAPGEPKFAQTYLFLGNMYQQIGQGEKALETWQQGLALYPENGQLSEQIDVTGGQ